MTGYTKLFGSIIASTIWREDNDTRIVWITMLAMAGRNGVVEASIPGLADMARVSVQACESALSRLEAPDAYSRTKDNDGRRIKPVDGGWMVLNHAKYRAKLNADERREYLRQKQREYRAVNKCQQLSTVSTQAEADAEAEITHKWVAALPHVQKRFTKPSDEELRLAGAKCGLPFSEVEKFRDYYESNGWRVGKNPMKSWTSALANWKRNWEERHGNHKNPGRPGVDRNANTANATRLGQYDGVGKIL